jgi:hypothetical protein
LHGYNPEQHDTEMVESIKTRGLIVHNAYDMKQYKDKFVVAYCDHDVLKEIPKIALAGKPKCFVWANCMTWISDDKTELDVHELGLIDYFIFQSEYQKKLLWPELSMVNPDIKVFENYIAWVNLKRYPMRTQDTAGYFGIGRCSRDDSSKYHEQTWRIMGQVTSPIPTKIFMLGFGENATDQCGEPHNHCTWMDLATWSVGGISIEEFWRKIHCLIHITGGSRENWPRCILESWGNGVVPVVDNDFGCVEMIENGVNGFLASSPDEASYMASQIAFDDDLRKRMVIAGFASLRDVHGNTDRAMAAWESLYAEAMGIDKQE